MATELKGIAASDGLFLGPVRRLRAQIAGRVPTGSPASERAALHAAIAVAVAELTSLMAELDEDAQDILGFQVAMLEDDALQAPALVAIDGGTAADIAWAQGLDIEIAGYEAAADDYFRARAADLRDIRDRVLRHLGGAKAETAAAAGVVLVGDDIAPTQFLEADWSQGGAIALCGGSPSSHVAMLARARGIPMVVGLDEAALTAARSLMVDGGRGIVAADPDEEAAKAFAGHLAAQADERAMEERFRLMPARRKDGRAIEVLINVAGADELAHIDVRSCGGIGLMRSEFLFRDGAPLPDEEQQYAIYRKILEWAEGRPVTIRTFDIGGDKPVGGLTPQGESNPFLGLRGIRLALAREDVFRVQLKALARAAVHGPLKIMIPMVTVPGELSRSVALLGQCVEELQRAGIPSTTPPLGIMVEVPAVAVAPDLFQEAAFFSIGSNDLTQYVTAASRDDVRVASLNDPAHPAVTRLIAAVARYGKDAGIPVSLCGDMASDVGHLKTLLDAGLTSISVAPARVARIKAALAEL